MNVSQLRVAIQSASAVTRFVSDGDLLVVLDTVGGIHMAAAADVLRSLDRSKSPRLEMQSVLTHLFQAAEAAFERGWRQLDNVLGRAADWSSIGFIHHKHVETLMLLVLCYLAIGEPDRALDYVAKIDSIRSKDFGPSDHNFEDKSVDGVTHAIQGAAMFGRILLMSLSLVNPRTYQNVFVEGDPEPLHAAEFVADAKRRCDEMRRNSL